MRNLTTIILLGLITSCGQSQKSSEKYSNKEGRFKVDFPVTPITKEQTGETEYGSIKTFSFVSKPTNDNNLGYELNYLDLPTVFTDSLEAEEIYSLFNGSQKTISNSPKIKLINTFNHQLLGYLGREYRWQDTESGVFSRVRFFLVNNRMYILSVNTNSDNNFNVDINKYFDSFELIETKPNPKASIEKKEDLFSSFNISFPKNPEKRELEAPTEFGTAKMTMYIFQPKLVNDKNLAYMVSEMKYTQNIETTKAFDLNKYYEQVVSFALNGRQSTLLSKQTVQIGNHEAIEFRESFKGGQIIIKQRTILKGDTQYSIQVMTIPANDENADMNNFFKSFSIKELSK